MASSVCIVLYSLLSKYFLVSLGHFVLQSIGIRNCRSGQNLHCQKCALASWEELGAFAGEVVPLNEGKQCVEQTLCLCLQNTCPHSHNVRKYKNTNIHKWNCQSPLKLIFPKTIVVVTVFIFLFSRHLCLVSCR